MDRITIVIIRDKDVIVSTQRRGNKFTYRISIKFACVFHKGNMYIIGFLTDEE